MQVIIDQESLEKSVAASVTWLLFMQIERSQVGRGGSKKYFAKQKIQSFWKFIVGRIRETVRFQVNLRVNPNFDHFFRQILRRHLPVQSKQ